MLHGYRVPPGGKAQIAKRCSSRAMEASCSISGGGGIRSTRAAGGCWRRRRRGRLRVDREGFGSRRSWGLGAELIQRSGLGIEGDREGNQATRPSQAASSAR